jgi:hypothetical protein
MTAHDGSQSLEFQELAPEVMIAQAESFCAKMQARRSVRDFSDRPVVRPVEPTNSPGISR